MARNIQLIGLILVVAGSFLPLVHIPVIGNWNYWQIDPTLAIICWVFSGFGLLGVLFNKDLLVKVSASLLIALFALTFLAVKFQSLEFFSFLPFKSWQETFAGVVKLSWGWLIEFSGALLMLLARKNNQ